MVENRKHPVQTTPSRLTNNNSCGGRATINYVRCRETRILFPFSGPVYFFRFSNSFKFRFIVSLFFRVVILFSDSWFMRTMGAHGCWVVMMVRAAAALANLTLTRWSLRMMWNSYFTCIRRRNWMLVGLFCSFWNFYVLSCAWVRIEPHFMDWVFILLYNFVGIYGSKKFFMSL